MVGGVKLKRVKYTNTGVTPLSVARTSDKEHYVFDSTKNGILSIYVIRVRNHSKNDSAKCKVYFGNEMMIINGTKESILCEISNNYLAYMLTFTDHIDLYKKLFKKSPLVNISLDNYVYACVLYKLKKDGVFNEN